EHIRPALPCRLEMTRKDALMKMRSWLLTGVTAAAWLWPATHAAERPTLAIQALVSASKQKNSGPLAQFAGVYDVAKSCKPMEDADGLLGTLWLTSKWVVWFEGDDLVFAQFLAPGNVVHGTLKFKRDYAQPRGPTLKLYEV